MRCTSGIEQAFVHFHIAGYIATVAASEVKNGPICRAVGVECGADKNLRKFSAFRIEILLNNAITWTKLKIRMT